MATVAVATMRLLLQKKEDIQMMLAADVHLGTKDCDFQMERTWEKLQLAARVIVAIEKTQDIIVQSARPYGQKAILKFAQYIGAHPTARRHTPRTFINQLQTSFSAQRRARIHKLRLKEGAKKAAKELQNMILIRTQMSLAKLDAGVIQKDPFNEGG